MRTSLLIVILGVCVLSCGRGTSVPAGILSAEKMEAVLWDLLRADQFVSNYVTTRDTSVNGHAKGPQLYSAILKKHGLTDSSFQVSMSYYKSHPKLLYPILDSIGQQPTLAPTPLATSPATDPTDSLSPQAVSAAPTTPSAAPKSTEKRPSFAPKPLAY